MEGAARQERQGLLSLAPHKSLLKLQHKKKAKGAEELRIRSGCFELGAAGRTGGCRLLVLSYKGRERWGGGDF